MTNAKSAIFKEPETFQALPIVALEPDMFASAEYVDPNARLPRIQALRGENGANECGYFLSDKDLANAGWFAYDEGDIIIYEYNSGGKERGLLIKQPRMLVKQFSPMFAIDKLASKEAEQRVIVGQYSKKLHSDRNVYQAATAFELLLLDANNNPLHEIPFAYIAKGANLGTFATKWQECTDLITQLHAKANGIPAKRKDARFKSMCVFEFTTKRELAGTTAKSPSCKVDDFTHPTMENWTNYFLGRNKEIAERLLGVLAPSNQLQLPATIEKDFEPIDDDIQF